MALLIPLSPKKPVITLGAPRAREELRHILNATDLVWYCDIQGGRWWFEPFSKEVLNSRANVWLKRHFPVPPALRGPVLYMSKVEFEEMPQSERGGQPETRIERVDAVWAPGWTGES